MISCDSYRRPVPRQLDLLLYLGLKCPVCRSVCLVMTLLFWASVSRAVIFFTLAVLGVYEWLGLKSGSNYEISVCLVMALCASVKRAVIFTLAANLSRSLKRGQPSRLSQFTITVQQYTLNNT